MSPRRAPLARALIAARGVSRCAARGVSRCAARGVSRGNRGRSLAPREREGASDQALGRGRLAEPSAGGVSQIASDRARRKPRAAGARAQRGIRRSVEAGLPSRAPAAAPDPELVSATGGVPGAENSAGPALGRESPLDGVAADL